MVLPGKDATEEVASDNVPKKENVDAANHESPNQNPANGVCPFIAEDKVSVVSATDGTVSSLTSEKALQTPQTPSANGARPLISEVKASDFAIVPCKVSLASGGGVTALQSNQEGSVSSLTSEKALRTPETNSVVLQSPGYEVSTSPRVREKPLEDGYNWRKYGQKLVRGNVVRSYYRCTHPKCTVKRQVERSQNGQITDTAHGSSPNKTGPVDLLKLSKVAENEVVQGVLSLTNRTKEAEPDPKRQKKEKHYGNFVPVDKPSTGLRVVQTMSEVDIVDDGYRWRKYGQKLVKGNPNPRSYYRCSNPGCPVKKHVERAINDTKVVIATYEGQHDHEVPPLRTITFHAAKSNLSPMGPIGDSGTKIEGETIAIATISRTSPEHESKPIERSDSESRTKSGTINAAASEMDVDTEQEPKRKANEQLIVKACVQEEGDPHKTIVCRAIKLQNGESGSIPSKQEIRKANTEPAQA